MLPDGGRTPVEVDFKRQVLFFWKDGAADHPRLHRQREEVLRGRDLRRRRHPVRLDRIQRRIKGKRKSYLGLLYDPLHFYGGYAIRGSPSVPGYPASQGCVRVPMHVSGWLFDNVPTAPPST